MFPRLLEAPPRTVLNLNVPARPYAEIGGVRWARLAAFGAVRAAVADTPDGVQFELRAVDVTPAPDSDTGLVAAGFAALTTIVGIAEAWPPERARPARRGRRRRARRVARTGARDPRRLAPPLAAPPTAPYRGDRV